MPDTISKISTIVKTCEDATAVAVNSFSPLADMPAASTQAENISHCLNTELAAYGFNSYVSPDRSAILVDDRMMSHIVGFLKDSNYESLITDEKIGRVKSLMSVADSNGVNLYWAQTGVQKKYYYLKQYGFNGVNLYNLLALNTANAAAARISATGAAPLSMAGVVALSWSGSLFLSTLENYVPSSMSATKASICGLKFVIALPIRCVEWTTNSIFGAVENGLIGSALPTNVTSVYALDAGPKLKNLKKIRKPIVNFLVKKLDKWG